MKSEAVFAMLCGVSPLPASSGMTQRHRLNRGGVRQANRAPAPRGHQPDQARPEGTQTYVGKRTGEGHSKMEIIRCLKRYVAREVSFILNPCRQHIVPNTRQRRTAAWHLGGDQLFLLRRATNLQRRQPD